MCFFATPTILFLLVLLTGCSGGDDKSPTASGGDGTEMDVSQLAGFGVGGEADFDVTASRSVRPTVSWDGGRASSVLVTRMGATSVADDPFAWWVSCQDGGNCISSPVAYRSSPVGTVDLIALGAEFDGGSTVAPASELEKSSDYIVLVTRVKSNGNISWGATVLRP